MPDGFAFIVTCEHASRFIPHRFRRLSGPGICRRPAHEQWDPGAHLIAGKIAEQLKAPYFPGTINRLLVELNRSLTHRELFSPHTADYRDTLRSRLLLDYYYPYRFQVNQCLQDLLANNWKVIHLSVHTFAPRLAGEIRRTDFGLLFDPLVPREKALSELWLEQIHRIEPSFRTRPNYPYLGTADGHVPLLRRIYRKQPYWGFELEFNQVMGQHSGYDGSISDVANLIVGSLRQAVRRKSVIRVLR